MSNIIPTNLKVPAHIASRMSQPSTLGGALTGGISDTPVIPRISIKGSRFRIIEGSAEEVLPTLALNVIIVGANPGLSKTWYGQKWSPDNEPTAPDCYSMDGISPAADATKPQSKTCGSCPHNQWGSRISEQGQKIKACADQKRLAVVDAENPLGPIYLLTVTPAALKNLNSYQKDLQRHGLPAEVVITRLSFDTTASFPKLKFEFGGFIPEHMQPQVDELFGSMPVLEVTGEASQPAQVALEVEKPVLVKQAAPKVDVQDAEFEESPKEEPKEEPKVSGFGRKRDANRPPAAEMHSPTQQKEKPVVQATTSQKLGAELAGIIEGLDFDDEPAQGN